MQKNFLAILVIFFGIVAAMAVMQSSLTDSSSAVSNATKWIGLGVAVFCFVRPKLGVMIVMIEAMTTDLLKKVATYYGTFSYETVAEVMGVVMVALLACFAGRLVQVTVGRDKFIVTEWVFYVVGAIIASAVFISMGGGLRGGQWAFNSGVYLGSGGLIVGMYRTREDRVKLMNLLLFLMSLWAVMALKQRFFGFADFQVAYHQSGLATASGIAEWADYPNNMPRPLGFGSNRVGFYGFAIGLAFCYYQYGQVKSQQKMVYITVILLFFSCLLLSAIKSAITIAIITIIPLCLIGSKFKTLFLYGVCSGLLLAMIFGAEYLRDNMTHMNSFVKSTFGEAYSISTFNPRLEGYMELTNPSNWTLFGMGRGTDVKSHDAFTRILINAGGLVLVMVVAGAAIFMLYPHLQIWKMEKGPDRKLAGFILPTTLAISVASLSGGLGIFAQPMPYLLSTGLGVVFATIVYSRENAVGEPVNETQGSETEVAQSEVVSLAQKAGRGLG
ncbi:hypothetical protein [Roseibacillus persicicus]|uniref:O-antigen ligase domain-containing protein n=1 Tax=Roseibacillus persicicus TaxID=454148 RepID=A0A918WPR9_9BACT|nr:hypothetical protein [Roseibacillus persicicus]GHC66244.1 hypothetical protein GCM10007100_37510 [Roseibacillus persicicus]